MKRDRIWAMVAVVGLAQPMAAEEVRMMIEYRDLDLASESGRAELDQRIQRAARRACGLYDVGTGSRAQDRRALRCVDETSKTARESIAAAIARDRRAAEPQ